MPKQKTASGKPAPAKKVTPAKGGGLAKKATSTGKASSTKPDVIQNETRRDFMVLAASATAGVGVVAAAWPFVDSMNPAADVLALSSTEVDISPIAPGQAITVMWRGKPVFIRHRTQREIQAARNVDVADLPDPQADSDRVAPGKDQWLVVVGICTHLGCVPLSDQGDYHAWFCPCHGSHYDTSGRIRKGPAPANLAVPKYTFLNDTIIRIG